MRDITPEEMELLERWGITLLEKTKHSFVATGRKSNGKRPDFVLIDDPESFIKGVAEVAAEAVRIIQEIEHRLMAVLARALEATAETLEEMGSLPPEEEPDQHDGAVTVAAELAPQPVILRKLYGQGVDYGGPGPDATVWRCSASPMMAYGGPKR